MANEEDSTLTLRERKKLRTMSSVVAATRELLAERDFDSITTKEVAARADVGEATLFRYIGSKANLFLHVYEELFEGVLRSCLELEEVDDDEVIDANTFIDRIAKTYYSLAELYKQDPYSGYVYVRESFGGEDSGHRGLELGGEWQALVARLIERGLAAGVLETESPSLIAQNVHAIYVHEVLASHARRRDPESIGDRLEERIRLALSQLIVA